MTDMKTLTTTRWQRFWRKLFCLHGKGHVFKVIGWDVLCGKEIMPPGDWYQCSKCQTFVQINDRIYL